MTKQKQDPKQFATGCGLFIVFGLCAMVWVSMQWSNWFGNGRYQSMATSICARVMYDYNDPCSTDWLEEYHMQDLQACYPDDWQNTDAMIDTAIQCMEDRGVNLIID